MITLPFKPYMKNSVEYHTQLIGAQVPDFNSFAAWLKANFGAAMMVDQSATIADSNGEPQGQFVFQTQEEKEDFFRSWVLPV